MPSIDGVFIHLAERFPCPSEAGSGKRRVFADLLAQGSLHLYGQFARGVKNLVRT
jgi:hypothetical protein